MYALCDFSSQLPLNWINCTWSVTRHNVRRMRNVIGWTLRNEYDLWSADDLWPPTSYHFRAKNKTGKGSCYAWSQIKTCGKGASVVQSLENVSRVPGGLFKGVFRRRHCTACAETGALEIKTGFVDGGTCAGKGRKKASKEILFRPRFNIGVRGHLLHRYHDRLLSWLAAETLHYIERDICWPPQVFLGYLFIVSGGTGAVYMDLWLRTWDTLEIETASPAAAGFVVP